MSQTDQKTTLSELVEAARSLSRNEFLETHTDPILLAMGVLDTEEIRSRCGDTTELYVAQPATHNPRVSHPLAGRVFPIPLSSRPAGALVFGREEPADILLPDETVSIRHCLIQWQEREVTIIDNESTNRTLVNLRPLRPNRPTELLNEDIITVGRHSFQYYLPTHFYRVLQSLAAPPSTTSI